MFVNNIMLKAATVPVKSATIFQSDTAELTRSLSLELKNGRNVVEISDISGAIVVESPRISGASGDVRVLDVVCKKKPNFSLDAPSAEMRHITTRGIALNAEREVRRQEAALLDASARMITSVKGETRGADAPMSGDQVLDFVQKVVKQKLAVQKALQNLDEEIEQLEKKLATLRNARKGEANVVITATIIASSDCKANLKLTYLVSGVSWRPFYDLHATTVDGQPSTDVSLRYCATITQATGEDWNDTVLTLSTVDAQAQRQLSVPSLKPLKITIPRGPISHTLARGSGFHTMTRMSDQRRQPAPTALFGSAVPPAVSEVQPIIIDPEPVPTSQRSRSASRSRSRSPTRVVVSQVTSPTRSSLSVAYRVQGTVSMPSDGEEHRLTVALLNFKANLNYICVPRQSPTVYIVSKVENTSEYDLLPGTVNVFMNDSFVTKTSINFISVNESFDCVLGMDTSIKVSYQKDEKTEHEPRRNFAEPQKTTTRTMVTTITNRHNFDIEELVVREAVPLGSENDKVHVVLRKPAGLAEAKDGQVIVDHAEGDDEEAVKPKVRWTEAKDGKGGEKDGLFEWICAIPAGKEVTLKAQWDVKSPSELDWAEQAQTTVYSRVS
ncbi:hypothetical protein BN946_scf185010.g56 [Trametes cinnabarina]|uniref:DUF4139 domain-containing protein n=1 Tax=Pycnoporus cinnabarinus TaxID=5643 RepID=A0A060SLR4_PYCCI|nr:hypothetical protein BN946_scf185010.g56 [Trametes cinnabarina]